MNIPILKKEDVKLPATGYISPFFDIIDNNLKAKKTDGTIIEFYKDESQLKTLLIDAINKKGGNLTKDSEFSDIIDAINNLSTESSNTSASFENNSLILESDDVSMSESSIIIGEKNE